MQYGVQRLATGRGISCEVLNKVPEQIKSFLTFHMYFTFRRILFKMGGIQCEAALARDPTFNQINNNYETPSFKGICAEFGISSRTSPRPGSGEVEF